MRDDESTCFLSFISLCFGMLFLVSMIHQRDLDEYGRDSYDRYNDVPGRDRWGYIVNHDGSYSFWGNLFDTNPYYAW